jgi:hypothetical protein
MDSCLVEYVGARLEWRGDYVRDFVRGRVRKGRDFFPCSFINTTVLAGKYG